MIDHQPAAPPPKRSRRDQARMVAGIAIAVVLTLLVVKNTQDVRIDFIVTETKGPLILALALAVLLGAALGALAAGAGRRRRGRKADDTAARG